MEHLRDRELQRPRHKGVQPLGRTGAQPDRLHHTMGREPQRKTTPRRNILLRHKAPNTPKTSNRGPHYRQVKGRGI